MALELIGGALLGAAVSELLKTVICAKIMLKSFKPSLEQLNSTLEFVIHKVEEIKGIDQIDKRPEIMKLIIKLREGITLVEKCIKVQSWNYYLQKRYSAKILELDNYLIRFFQLDVQAAIWCDVVQILGKVNHMDGKLDLLTTERASSSGSKNGAGGVPGLETAVPNRLLHIQPPREMKFAFKLWMESTSSIQLVNRSDQYVAFKVRTTAPTRYCVRPNMGIVHPKSTRDITVIRQAPEEASDIRYNDKFLVVSTVFPFRTDESAITPDYTFDKDNGNYIEEHKLSVILVSPTH